MHSAPQQWLISRDYLKVFGRYTPGRQSSSNRANGGPDQEYVETKGRNLDVPLEGVSCHPARR
jgi:hypothetical protein